MKKIKDILTTDIKLINSYLLTLIVLVTISVTSLGTYAIFTYDKQSSNLIKIVYQPPESLDKSGANAPVLATGMIPVYYDSTENVWRKADETNSNETYKWYDYDNKMWANAVTVTSTNRATYLNDSVSPVGTTIPMSDINTMWVWIPRYSAESWEGIEGECSSGYSYLNSENIETTFVDSNKSVAENYFIESGNLSVRHYRNQKTFEATLVESAANQDEEFAYNINPEGSTGEEVDSCPNPGAFTINFVGKNEDAHEAFTFGGQELSGMWVGKFENSSDTTCSPSGRVAVGSGCNLTSIRPKIIPNVESWRGAMVSTFFLDILNMKENGNQYGFDTSVDNTLDTHMIKNSEWGAVAYLSQSIYGRCSNQTTCPEIGINNNSSYKTGYGSPAGSSSTATNGTYETALGQLASTTGNIYGIYDMSGGADDYVMGVYWDGTNKWSGLSLSLYFYSGFNGCLGSGCLSTYEEGVPYPDEKYYDLYTNTGDDYSLVTDYTGDRQHALIEAAGWYDDGSGFVDGEEPWFVRGYYYDAGSDAGLFSYNYSPGLAYTSYGSFSVIVK